MPPKSSEEVEVSPMMDFTDTTKESAKKDDTILNPTPTMNKYTYILLAVVVVIVMYLAYYAYKSFYDNQGDDECFIEKTVKTGPDSDAEFDMDVEVSKLKRLQEKYLASINRR